MIIIGASGHGRVVSDIVLSTGDEVVGFLDDDIQKNNVIGKIDECEKFNNYEFIIAIGNQNIREKISKKNLKWYTAIHKSAIISNNVSIGEGSVIMPNVVINTGSNIGRHCIVNTGAIIEHDNKVEDYVHVSVGAKIGGGVSIGKSTWVGIGATIINNVNICANCMIGAGAVVIKNIEDSGVYVGVPAIKINK